MMNAATAKDAAESIVTLAMGLSAWIVKNVVAVTLLVVTAKVEGFIAILAMAMVITMKMVSKLVVLIVEAKDGKIAMNAAAMVKLSVNIVMAGAEWIAMIANMAELTVQVVMVAVTMKTIVAVMESKPFLSH
jgi:hypothetical protein